MKKNRLSNGIAYGLFVLFLATKLIGLHALTHHHDTGDYLDHCEICLNIAHDSQTPGIVNDTIEPTIENPVVFYPKVASTYYFQASGTLTKSHLFSRPPPSV
ncbi:MAG: hypothetical protein GYB37_01305 [Algicola sp.]|nr:hypothetical protein [Algicola sp.]